MKSLLFVLLLTLHTKSFAGGTVVGNGGDPIFEFLEAARISMIETVKIIAIDPTVQTKFCQKSSLSQEQIEFCQTYFQEVTSEILQLNQGPNKTLFVLREDPLLVEGPDGKDMIVSARTDLGPNGVVEFHRDSVKTMTPVQVLFLIAHEFQHKASFRGVFVTDNDPIGPFVLGRDLLDAASSAVVATAKRAGKVGSNFGIRDVFNCLVSPGGGSRPVGTTLPVNRLFQTEDLMSYVTASGKNPMDGALYLPETNSSSILFRFEIKEPNNCGDPDPARKTKLQILRSTQLIDGSFQEDVLALEEKFMNPMCPGADRKLELAWDQVKFKCEYYGSQGATTSPVTPNSVGSIQRKN